MSAQWRPVVGWTGWYEVSNLGQVRGTSRTSQRRDGTAQNWVGRELRPFPNYKGYLVVRLSRPGKRLQARVHRLVAEAFLPAGHTVETVNHKDGDKTNNRASNLEWATRSENTRHAVANGLGDYVPPWRKRAARRPPPPDQLGEREWRLRPLIAAGFGRLRSA